MSDNIPFEIQSEIIKKLPVKSLIRFRSVSKSWKSLIDSSDFIAGYHNQTQVQHLLVMYTDRNDSNRKYVTIVDDDNTFPQQKVSLTVPLFISKLKSCSVVGSSHGLLCLFGYYYGDDALCGRHVAFIWNIFIKKAVVVVVPRVDFKIHHSYLGFGVCRETGDPRIVKVIHGRRAGVESSVESSAQARVPTTVEVFTLSTGSWRRSYSNVPRDSISFMWSHMVIDGFIYWLATDEITVDGEFRSCNLIISFDITREEFKEINLPDSLALCGRVLEISKLRNSLVVLETNEEVNVRVVSVWMMEDGVSKSFTKLFTVYTPDATIINVRGFRKSGESIVEIVGGPSRDYFLALYEPNSKHINNLGIKGTRNSFKVYPCMETLLLLDQPDLTVYNNGKRYILKLS